MPCFVLLDVPAEVVVVLRLRTSRLASSTFSECTVDSPDVEYTAYAITGSEGNLSAEDKTGEDNEMFGGCWASAAVAELSGDAAAGLAAMRGPCT